MESLQGACRLDRVLDSAQLYGTLREAVGTNSHYRKLIVLSLFTEIHDPLGRIPPRSIISFTFFAIIYDTVM